MTKPKSSGPVQVGEMGMFYHMECGHTWKPRAKNPKPKRCPKCNNLLVYEEDLKSK